MANVIHAIGSADFSTYIYKQIVVDGTATINGETVVTTGPITLDIGVTNSGSTSGDVYLLGNKRPELLTNLNSDGKTRSIKG